MDAIMDDSARGIVSQNELTPKQLVALDALMAGERPMVAAAKAGVHVGTLYRWLADEKFAATLRAFEGTALQDLGRRLAALGDKVAQALADGLDARQPIGVRLKAADIVVGRLLALAEIAQITQRLEAIERRLDGGQEGDSGAD